jgi:cell division protein FtsI (penicillin-binding protein 3)
MTRKSGGPKTRILILSLVLIAGFLIIGIRLFFLQVVHASSLADRAEKQRQKTIMIEGERGTIFDRKGRVLAVNLELPSVFSTPGHVHNPSQTAKKLGRLLGKDPSQLKKRIKGEKSFVWIERKMDPSLAEKVQKLDLNGIGFLMESRRFYPKRTLMSHVLGFAGVDNNGLEGLELRYDEFLKGEKGWVVLERDALGGFVFPKDLVYAQPSRGKDIVLTLDEVIQFISDRELDRAIEETSAKGGVVIAMDPYTGGILSLSVRPQFNPNHVGRHEPSDWRNRAITDLYEPGSTFKIVAAAAALEEGLVSLGEPIDCENGALRVGSGFLDDHEPHGILTFEEVLQKSSNIGIFKVANRLGNQKLYQYVKAFGFGKKTDIDLNGEVAGVVHPPSQWSGRSLASMAMGQEVGVTALQVIGSASVIANGGWLPQPHLVSEIRDEEGNSLLNFSYPLSRRVISEKTARSMTRILKGVVQGDGTGELAAFGGYEVAGKTGTAQKVDPSTGRYSRGKVISSFIGFVPADHPRVIIYVVLDEPKGVHWGGTVAAPVFKRIAEQTLSYMGVMPEGKENFLLVSQK